MKEFLKRFGIIFIFFGVLVLSYTKIFKLESNQLLLISGGLIMGGFIIYVIINNIID